MHLTSTDLDRLRSGVVRLRVPVVDDKVQIGLGGSYLTTTLEIVRRDADILIRRADGALLQAQIVHDWQPGGGSCARTDILSAPVPRLRLRRCATTEPIWRPVGVGACRDLGRLIDIVARFAVQRQGYSQYECVAKASASW